MIDLNTVSLFVNNKSTIEETSVSTHSGSDIPITTITKEAINFDNVKYEYVQNLGLSEIPKSNDALFIKNPKEAIFIEFKSGKIDKQKQYAIRKKIYDSALIFSDIVKTDISEMRNCVDYVLVYNDTDDNKTIIEKEIEENRKENKAQEVQSSESFNYIANGFSQQANKEYVAFGIRMFKKYCFRDVHTYTVTQFENYLQKIG